MIANSAAELVETDGSRGTRDLFRMVFNEFSQFDWHTYQSEFVSRLPSHMLSAVAVADAELRGDRAFQRMRTRLDACCGDHWNNPELYPHIHKLMQRSSGEPFDRYVRNLEFQMGAIDLEPGRFEPGFYRRRTPAPAVWRLFDDRVMEVPDVVVSHSIAGPFPVFYMPYPGLFTDIVGRNAYNGANEKFSSQYARKMVEAAASSLAAYSPELYAGFCEAVGVVALTGEPDVQDRSSFSARMYFAGGIFSSLLRDNVPALIENLIHEYFHQRLWVWWSIEGPQDLPPETVTIVSPVTKTQKSVRVMLHAFLIYIGVSAYYRFALEHEVMSVQAREWVERRHARLSAGCADLRELLLESLGAYPESRRLAQFMADLIPSRCC